jgi:hypothetical protein
LDFETDANGNALTDPTGGNSFGIGDQWEDWGVRIQANKKNNQNQSEPLLLFHSESNNYTGGDKDLRTGSPWGTEEQGNVLIIQEDGWRTNRNGDIVGVKNANDPDDEANGGWITFDFFDAPVKIEEFSLLDIDDNGGGIQVRLWDQDDNETTIDIDDLMGAHKAAYGSGTYDGYQESVSWQFGGSDVTMTQDSSKRGDNSMFTFNMGYENISKLQFRYPGSGAISGLKWSDGDEDTPSVPEPTAGLGVLLFGAMGIKSLRKRQQQSEATG